MYKDQPAGLFRFGYVEDLENIDNKNLYEYYQKLLKECKIDIFISGKIDNNEILKMIEENENIKKLNSRKANYIVNDITSKEFEEEKKIEEKMDVVQGKLVIGCDILFDENDIKDKNLRYQAMIYNSLLRRKCKFKII